MWNEKIEKAEPFKTKITQILTHTQSKIADLLNGALDIGTVSRNWIQQAKINRPEGYTPKNSYATEVPFLGGTIEFLTFEGDKYILDLKSIEKGLKIFLNLKYEDGTTNKFVQDFLNNDPDGFASDMFLQCCLFGEVVYG